LGTITAMSRVCIYLAIMLMSVSSIFAPGAAAQTAINSIEVLVNDEPISSHDINERLRLVIAVSGGVSSQEEVDRVREQVIRAMVDERLQIQEAAEVELVIPDAQLEEYFGRRAEGFGQTPVQLEQTLRGIGSSKRSIKWQLNAELAWSQLVQGRFGSFASVSDEEVEDFIARLRANKGKFEYRLSEIVLQVSDPSQADRVKRDAETLVSRLRDGASFGDIAQQLSASPSAAVGGDLGWIPADTLNDLQRSAVESVELGSVSDPIRTAGSYVIYAPADRRRIMVADPLDTQLQVRQFYLPRQTMTDDPARVERFRSKIEPLETATTSCDDADTIALDAGAEERTDVGYIRLRALAVDVRSEAGRLSPGQATRIFDMNDGLRALLVCDVRAAQADEPDFDRIMDQLEQQRLSMIARRYLRDIRRDAIIDYR